MENRSRARLQHVAIAGRLFLDEQILLLGKGNHRNQDDGTRYKRGILMKYSMPDVEAFNRFTTAVPMLVGCQSLRDAIALPHRTLLHAGPPYEAVGDIVAPVLNTAANAAVFEGWADDLATAKRMIADGAIQLRPAQDYSVVTPLAFVVSPSMSVLSVQDQSRHGGKTYTPVNDGPPMGASRFGSPDVGSLDRLAFLRDLSGDLDAALKDPIDLLELMRIGLSNGDDLHGRVAATTELLCRQLSGRASATLSDYLATASQFGLNVVMAACGTMLSAATGVRGSSFVVGAGGNGQSFGWRISDAPSCWRVQEASVPLGQCFKDNVTVLPAIGDSAVIDACGFGAAALRYNAEFRELAGFFGTRYFEELASSAYFGSHGAFPPSLKLGLVATPRGIRLGVLLAILDADGRQGLVGRGIAECIIS